MKSKRVGHCSICGSQGQLTFEHIPPKAAFNKRGVLYNDMNDFLAVDPYADPRFAPKRKGNRGAGGFTLCSRCNNDTGAWYGNAYVDWAAQGMSFAHATASGSSLYVPFHMFPAQVAKQIFCMFASACGPGLFETNPELTRYVLNRDQIGVPDKFRIYAFLMSPLSTLVRQTGITGLMKGGLVQGSVHHFAELSFPPFGYILTLESEPPDRGLQDITFFTDYRYRDFRSLHLRLPMREVNSYFPADFRTVDEWDAAIKSATNRPRRTACLPIK